MAFANFEMQQVIHCRSSFLMHSFLNSPIFCWIEVDPNVRVETFLYPEMSCFIWFDHHLNMFPSFCHQLWVQLTATNLAKFYCKISSIHLIKSDYNTLKFAIGHTTIHLMWSKMTIKSIVNLQCKTQQWAWQQYLQ